jgi:hypothetical protein
VDPPPFRPPPPYEPPESHGPGPKSQKYDTWSIGRIFLDFTIWLLHGNKRVNALTDPMFSRQLESLPYESEDRRDVVHPAVRAMMDEIRNGPAAAALKDLVTLIDEKLFRLESDRADATELHTRL